MSAIWLYVGPMSSRLKRSWEFRFGYLVVPIPVSLRKLRIVGRSSTLSENMFMGLSMDLLLLVRGHSLRRCFVDRVCPQVHEELGSPGKASLGVVRVWALNRALVA